jgi:hypothetical protein
MRRYFFDLRIGNELGEDNEGALLPDLEAVQKEALRTLADAAKELLGFPTAVAIEVRDEDGPVMQARVVFEINRTN